MRKCLLLPDAETADAAAAAAAAGGWRSGGGGGGGKEEEAVAGVGPNERLNRMDGALYFCKHNGTRSTKELHETLLLGKRQPNSQDERVKP